MIQLDDVCKSYRRPGANPGECGIDALIGIDLRVETGGLATIVGPAGCGKTTLLRCVNLLEPPDEGSIRIGAQEITGLTGYRLRAARRQVGMVVAGGALLEQRTVRRGVGMPLDFAHGGRRDRDLLVDELLDLVGLSDAADHYPSELSALQRVRAAIARALVTSPAVLLCDDPARGLPAVETRRLFELLEVVRMTRRLTTLIVTRDIFSVRENKGECLLLDGGRTLERGTIPELLDRPGSRLAADLMPELPAPVRPADGRLLVDLTFLHPLPSPVLTSVAQEAGVEIAVQAGDLAPVADRSVGRLRLELLGSADQCTTALRSFSDLDLEPVIYS